MLEVDQKINTYQVALNNVIKQLRDKRSELADLAKKTVAEIDASIPKLQKKCELLKSEISKLEKALDAKKKEYEAQRSSCLSEFEAMKTALAEEHAEAVAELKDATEDMIRARSELAGNISLADSRQATLDISKESLEKAIEAHKRAVEAFEKEKKDFASYARETKHALSSNEEVNRGLNALAKQKIEELDKLKSVYIDKMSRADEILARNNEAATILERANSREEENKRREAELNSANIKLIVDKQKIESDAVALKERQYALDQREKNIKTVEASLLNRK